MKSTVLTKINTISMPFKEQVLALRGSGDMDFLKKFVLQNHKSACLLIKSDRIEAHTNKSSFLYRIYPTVIIRINTISGSKKFYKIS